MDVNSVTSSSWRCAVDSARREWKIKLVYWVVSLSPGRVVVSQPLLDEFGGLLVDRKATFHVDRSADPGPGEPMTRGSSRRIIERHPLEQA